MEDVWFWSKVRGLIKNYIELVRIERKIVELIISVSYFHFQLHLCTQKKVEKLRLATDLVCSLINTKEILRSKRVIVRASALKVQCPGSHYSQKKNYNILNFMNSPFAGSLG